jgi:chaperonin GroES
MTFRPLYDRLVVQRREVTEEAHSGIIIPDTAKDKPHEGEVIAVGPGKRRKDGQYQPIFAKITGSRDLQGARRKGKSICQQNNYAFMKPLETICSGV